MRRPSLSIALRLVACASPALAQAPRAVAAGAATAPRAFTLEDVLAVRVVSDPQLSPDGSRVAYVVSRADMKENAADGRTLWFTAPLRTGAQLFAAGVASGAVRQLSHASGLMGTASIARDGRLAAFTLGSVTAPNDVHVAALGANPDAKSPAWRPRRLTDHNPQVGRLALGRGEIIRWKSRDGMEVEGLVIYPADYQRGRRCPTIAFIHGGPAGVWTAGFPASWGNYAHAWASGGWVSFFPNVRGSSGYGEKFLLANVRDWGGGDFQDIQTGLDTLVARRVADPDRSRRADGATAAT